MIKNIIIIKEEKGGTRIVMHPENINETEIELRIARLIDLALEAAGECLNNSTAVSGNSDRIREYCKRYIQSQL